MLTYTEDVHRDFLCKYVGEFWKLTTYIVNATRVHVTYGSMAQLNNYGNEPLNSSKSGLDIVVWSRNWCHTALNFDFK